MNNKVIGIIAAVVVIAGLGWFILSKKGNNQPAQTQTQTSQPAPAPTPLTQKSSLRDLMSGGDKTCTYSDAGNSGTIYISSGKTRMDMTAVSNGATSSMHSIMDGQTSYTWIDGQATGFKSSMTSTTTTPATGTGAQSSQQVDPNKQLNYVCSSWSVDSSKFVLPTNIQFMDLSSLKIPTIPTK